MKHFITLIIITFSLLSNISHAAIIDDMAAGSWLEIPNTKLNAIIPSETAPGNSGASSIMNTWSGAAYDSKRDRLMVWGGGHADYSGNEIYAFSLSSLSWELVEPSTPNNLIPYNNTAEMYSDGKPVSRHTYDGLEYLPAPFDVFLSHGGSRWSNGYGTDAIWVYDFSASSWIYKGKAESGSRLGIITVFDPTTQKLLIRGQQNTSVYDPATNQSTVVHTNGAGWWNANNVGALDPTRGYLVMMGNGDFDVFDSSTNTYFKPHSVEKPPSSTPMAPAWHTTRLSIK